jgi:hypothetical protein
MKNLMVLMCCTFLFFVFSSQVAMSNETGKKRNTEKNKQVNAKCHVSLINGNEDILLYRIKAKKYPKLSENIVGKKVTTSTSNKKIKIYKVHQCVLDDEAFSHSRAKLLDEKTMR